MVCGPPFRRNQPRLWRFVLLALLVWALALRLWNGSHQPHAGRFWDERHSLQNIHRILTEDTLRPQNGHHPGLSYYPYALLFKISQTAYETLGIERLAVLDERSKFTPGAYLLARRTQAALGVLSIYLTFLIGRRVFGANVALLGAFLLAAAPWHIRQSSIYKPDILLVATTLLALLLTLRALERPTWARYLWVGGAIGLALSSKFNAAPVAIPLVVGTLLDRPRWRNLLPKLVASGGLAVVVFLLFNPYVVVDLPFYRYWFGKTLTDYQRKGTQRAGGSHWAQAIHLSRTTVSVRFLGLVSGLGAVAGIVRSGWKVGRRPATAVALLVICSYVLGYAILYAVATANPSEHNWLPLLPFLALLAAWVLLDAWRWISQWLPVASRRILGWICIAVLVGWHTLNASSYVYKEVLPSTTALASHVASRLPDPLTGRLVVSDVEIPWRERKHKRIVFAFSDTTAAGRLRALSDAQIVTPHGDLQALDERATHQPKRRRVGPVWFGRHGPTLEVIRHPWTHLGDAMVEGMLVSGREGTYAVELPDDWPDRAWVTVQVAFHGRVRPAASLKVALTDGSVVDFYLRGKYAKSLYVTSRFRAEGMFQIDISKWKGERSRSMPVRLDLWREPPGHELLWPDLASDGP